VSPVRLRLAIFFLALSVHLQPAGIQEASFTAAVNAERIGLDDILVYTLTYTGNNNPQTPELPMLRMLRDFRLLQQSTSSEVRLLDGDVSYATHFYYHLLPLRTGKLSIPAVRVRLAGKEFRSNPVFVEVVPGSVLPKEPFSAYADDSLSPSLARGEPIAPGDLFLQVRASPQRVFRNQQVNLAILLYSRKRIESATMISNRSFPGCWQEWYPVPEEISSRYETLNGKTYYVFEVNRAALFPTHAGQLTIPAFQFEIAMIASNFGLLPLAQKVVRSSEPLAIRVAELPADAADLPVGNFSFSLQADRLQANINDLAILRLHMVGDGNFKTLSLPAWAASEDFIAYPEKVSQALDYGSVPLTGSLTAEIPISFRRAGSIRLPSLDFAFFDPHLRRVVHAPSGEMTIAVSVPAGRILDSGAAVRASEPPASPGGGIGGIQKGKLGDQDRFFFRSGWFDILLFFPFLFNLAFGLKRLVWEHWLADHPARLRKRILARALDRLNRVNSCEQIAAVLEEYLRQKTDIPQAEMSGERIAEWLANRRVRPADAELFLKIKARSELARYAALEKASQSLAADLDALKGVLRSIDRQLS